DGLAGRPSEPVSELTLRFPLGIAESGPEVRISGQRFKLAQFTEIGNPTVADGVGDGSRERGICQQQPPPRCDSIRFIIEPLWKDFRQVPDCRFTQQFGVNCGYTIRAV